MPVPASTAGLDIRLFGPFTVLRNESPLPPLRTRKGLWLLALLSLRHEQEVDRNWLAGTLWPDSSESQALYNLRRSLSDLRSALGPAADCLTTPTTHTLRLVTAAEAVDVIQFDTAIARGDSASLDAAIALYRGPLLEGCPEPWAQPEAEKRQRAYLTALETRAADAVEQNDPARAEELARRAISADPRRESAWRLLLTALAKGGNLAALTMAYRDLRLSLLRDMNVLPDSQTTALFEKLRAEARQPPPPQRADAPPANPEAGPLPTKGALPRPLTPLIGRETHIAAAAEMLRASRLLTLTGSGGIGKTRLALGVGEAVAAEYEDGVWFVDLATISDPALVPRQVASALNVREQAGSSIQAALRHALAPRHLLLVLDNCEHLLETCARLAEELLEGAPQLWLLATSRTPLGILGEATYRVPSLSVPPPKSLPLPASEVAELMQYASVRLFAALAGRHQPDFQLTPENATPIVEICRRLDGIPLALELAAARTRHLSAAEIADRLDNAIAMLTGGSRTVPRRQTLRASIDWSWSLLKSREQAMLARLSVFAGGFTLAAAETVCSTTPFPGPTKEREPARMPGPPEISREEMLDLLGALVDSSLVNYSETGERDRYRIPETIRQYAALKLLEAGDEAAMRHCHADYFLALAETAWPHLQGGASMTAWLNMFETEHDNLRQALNWYEKSPDAEGMEKGLRLAGALQTFWITRGYYMEGRQRLTALLKRTEALPPTSLRAFALNGAGQMAAYQADQDAAQALHQQALTIYREREDRNGIAETLNHFGQIARQREQYAAAESCFLEALAIVQQQETSLLTGLILYNLGTVYYRTGRLSESESHHTKALQEFERQGNRHQRALPLLGLAHIARKAGRAEEAHRLTVELLGGCQETGDIYYTIFALELAGHDAWDRGAAQRAALLVGAATAFRESLGNRPTRAQQEDLDGLLRQIEAALGTDEFAAAFARGRRMSVPEAIGVATGSVYTMA